MHCVDNGFQCQAKSGDLIFHLRRYFRIHRPLEEATFLHIAQLVSEYFLRNPGNSPLEVGEPLYSFEEIP